MTKEKKNSILKRALPAGLLAGLCLLSVGAWLTTNQTATSTNTIKPGTISIKFDNEQNAVNIQNAFPVSNEYAEGNYTPYTYSIVNDGDMDLDYVVGIKDPTGDLMQSVTFSNYNTADNTGTKRVQFKYDQFNDYTFKEGKDKFLSGISGGKLAPGETAEFTLLAYVGESAKLDDVNGKNANFGLEVYAEQSQEGRKWGSYERPGATVESIGNQAVTKMAQALGVDSVDKVVEYKAFNSYEINYDKYQDKINQDGFNQLVQQFKDAGFSDVFVEEATTGQFQAGLRDAVEILNVNFDYEAPQNSKISVTVMKQG